MRGSQTKAAQLLGVHPSTVSRNKQRPDIAIATQAAGREIRNELLTNQLNRNDVERTNSDSRPNSGG